MCISTSFSQVVFYNSGTIKYERKINAFRLTEGSWMNRMFEVNKFKTDTFTMVFDSARSIYSRQVNEDEELDESNFWFSMNVAPDKSNIVYKNLQSDSVLAIRDLFDETIAIGDSMRKIQWKIMHETREIAGFTCKKAIGILHDSLYVVAFYCDEIIPSNGPETISGLPGTIMGLAIPRLYATWMAVSFDPVIQSPIKAVKNLVKKKSQYNWNSYHTAVSERFKDWGEPYTTLFVWMWGI